MRNTNYKIVLAKHIHIYRLLRDAYYFVFTYYRTIIFYIFRIFPVKANKIVVSNFKGKGYGDNPKYIINEILRRQLFYDIVWIVDNIDEEMPYGIRKVKRNTVQEFYELSTAKLWIDNTRKAPYVRKRKNQYYIQTWHAGLHGKKVEKDAIDSLDRFWRYSSINDSRMADLFLSNSTFVSQLFRNSFWYTGEIFESGLPRLDSQFISNIDKETIRKKLDISKKKIILYAPTFRSNKRIDVYNIDFDRLKKHLILKFGGDWIVLLRLHPAIVKEVTRMDLTNVLDCTSYPDIYELLAIADILITDYSSCMFEMNKKPVFRFAVDLEEYTKDRGFYFDIHELPYPLSESNDELIDIIDGFEESEYIKNVNLFLVKNGVIDDGRASSRVVDRIEDLLKKDDLD